MRPRDSVDDDDLHDHEDPDASDMDDSDEPELVACPFCRKMISEDAELCHHCRNYIVRDDPPGRIPWWVLAGAVLAGLTGLIWMLR